MPSSTLQELEWAIQALPWSEQLRLLEYLAGQVRKKAEAAQRWAGGELEAQLTAMAQDPAIQREVKAIAQEFAPTEADGLDLQ
ncbi:MAG TPA: hypothetical protein ENI60_07230 [Candidatus Fraserbacteria bacterium]|nr:hypothetical protein [Candidatus Fraserbacteria bacterium]